MRKLVTKAQMGASLRADFDEALRMVPLRGLSGDAKRAASMTLRQPASKTPYGLARISNPSITSKKWSTALLRYYGKRRQLGHTQAHADQRIKRRISLQSELSLTGNRRGVTRGRAEGAFLTGTPGRITRRLRRPRGRDAKTPRPLGRGSFMVSAIA